MQHQTTSEDYRRIKNQTRGNALSGRAEWDGHRPGKISGKVEGRTIKFDIQYED